MGVKKRKAPAALGSTSERLEASRVSFPERRAGEGARAYAAFITYLMLEVRPRTVEAAWRIYKEEHGLTSKQPGGAFKRWAADNSWIDRALAWDMAALEERMAERALIEEQARQVAYDAAPDMIRVLIDLANNATSEAVKFRAAKHILALAGVVSRKYDLTDEDANAQAQAQLADALRGLRPDELDELRAWMKAKTGSTPPARPTTPSIAPNDSEAVA